MSMNIRYHIKFRSTVILQLEFLPHPPGACPQVPKQCSPIIFPDLFHNLLPKKVGHPQFFFQEIFNAFRFFHSFSLLYLAGFLTNWRSPQ
jgi:hypothetical protein